MGTRRGREGTWDDELEERKARVKYDWMSYDDPGPRDRALSRPIHKSQNVPERHRRTSLSPTFDLQRGTLKGAVNLRGLCTLAHWDLIIDGCVDEAQKLAYLLVEDPWTARSLDGRLLSLCEVRHLARISETRCVA